MCQHDGRSWSLCGEQDRHSPYVLAARCCWAVETHQVSPCQQDEYWGKRGAQHCGSTKQGFSKPGHQGQPRMRGISQKAIWWFISSCQRTKWPGGDQSWWTRGWYLCSAFCCQGSWFSQNCGHGRRVFAELSFGCEMKKSSHTAEAHVSQLNQSAPWTCTS